MRRACECTQQLATARKQHNGLCLCALLCFVPPLPRKYRVALLSRHRTTTMVSMRAAVAVAALVLVACAPGAVFAAAPTIPRPAYCGSPTGYPVPALPSGVSLNLLQVQVSVCVCVCVCVALLLAYRASAVLVAGVVVLTTDGGGVLSLRPCGDRSLSAMVTALLHLITCAGPTTLQCGSVT